MLTIPYFSFIISVEKHTRNFTSNTENIVDKGKIHALFYPCSIKATFLHLKVKCGNYSNFCHVVYDHVECKAKKTDDS